MIMKSSELLIGLLLSALILLDSGRVAAQPSFMEKSELGILLGASYYTGDLNRMGHFQQMSPAVTLLYRYNKNSRLAWRGSVMVGRIKGDDANSRYEFNQNRNLNFRSNIIEGAVGLEFNYLPYATGRLIGERFWYSSYMIVQVAGFYFNPRGEYNNEWYELQPLGTEGQGTELSNRDKYRRFQISIPIGLGFKLNVKRRLSVSIEYGARLTFTDYLDDVSGTYVDPNQLAGINGDFAAQFSKGQGRTVGSRRGDGVFNDWYMFFGMGITYKLGVRPKCPYND